MGMACEVVGVQVTAPGAAGAAALAIAGSSLTIRNSTKPVWLVDAWQSRQAAGFMRVTSPLLHDAVVGMRMHQGIGRGLCGIPGAQRVQPQDSLQVLMSGSAVPGDIEQACLFIAYEDLPGVAGRFLGKDVLGKIESVYAFQNTLATGLVGGWSGAEAISAEDDQLKADRDYALLGFETSVAVSAIGYTGPDWGNLRVGGPGATNSERAFATRTWFVDMSERSGMPCVPVLNSSNKALVLIDALQDENGADPVVTTYLGLLRQGKA